jgi:MFS family permease
LGLFGGVLADRLEKKRIIQVGQVVATALALFVAVSITTGTVTWQHLLFASIVQGMILPLIMPARQAIIPQLVGRERMMNAVALNSMGMSLTTMIAPAVAGGVIGWVGIATVYYLIAAMNLGSVLLTHLLPKLQAASRRSGASPLADLADGLRYVRSSNTLVLLLLLSLSTMVLAMPIRFILPIFAKDVFSVGSGGLGAMMSFMGLGALMGALAIASAGKLARRGTLLAGAGVVSGAVLLGFTVMSQFAPVFWASLVFMTLIGVVQSARMTLNNSLMMEYADEEYRGRVMGLFTLNMALLPAGVLPITLVAERVGAPVALGIMALVLMVLSAVILGRSKTVRRLV